MPRASAEKVAEALLAADPERTADRIGAALAQEFAVSQHAMQFRLQNLGYWSPT